MIKLELVWIKKLEVVANEWKRPFLFYFIFIFLNSTNLFLIVLKLGKFNVKVLADLVYRKSPLPGLRTANLLCVSLVFIGLFAWRERMGSVSLPFF